MLVQSLHDPRELFKLIVRHDVCKKKGLEIIERGLRKLLSSLSSSGKRVWLVDEVPNVGFNIVRRHAIYLIRGKDERSLIGLRRNVHELQSRKLRALLIRLQEEYSNFKTIDLSGRLCQAERCALEHDGKFLYVDENHLSRNGALFVSQELNQIFANKH